MYVIETVYSILALSDPVVRHTIFLNGLLFGREIGWSVRPVTIKRPFTQARHNLWPHTAARIVPRAAVGGGLTQPAGIPYRAGYRAWPALAIQVCHVTRGRCSAS